MRPAAAATLTQRRLTGETGIAASRDAAREAQHARGLAEVREAVENPRALGVEHGVVERGVGFGKGGVAQRVGIGRQPRQRRPRTASQLRRRARSDWSVRASLSGARRDKRQRRQPIERHVDSSNAHFCSPNSARNFRIARNRCTRTVAGLMPVASLISAAVRSSRCDSVNTSR